MTDFLLTVMTQSFTFLPLAFGISISYHILRVTDMTIDGSFVIGAAVFAKCMTLGLHPIFSALFALAGGVFAGMLTATMQRGGKVDGLLAGILAAFILSSLNLIIMGKPNINLLSMTTLVSAAFEKNEYLGWLLSALLSASFCLLGFCLLKSRIGLILRAFGDNPALLKRTGKNIEGYRLFGFAFNERRHT